MKNAAVVNQNRVCVSLEFLQNIVKEPIDIRVIDGVQCIFTWDKLEPGSPKPGSPKPGSPKPNMTPKESYLKYQSSPIGKYYTDTTKHWMGTSTLGGNADNNQSRPKDSTFQDDFIIER